MQHTKCDATDKLLVVPNCPSVSDSKSYSDVPNTVMSYLLVLLFRPVDHCGLTSVAALTTARAYAPELMQASSFPERLRLLFRVSFNFEYYLWKMQSHSKSLFSHLETSVFPVGAFHL